MLSTLFKSVNEAFENMHFGECFGKYAFTKAL